MRAFAARVRQAWVGLTLFATPAVALQAQVAIQVKSGTIWTSNIELKALAPLTFRWRWDGTETPTAVSWQLAAVAPTSTATTRASDVVASETAMRLPAQSGTYDEFTVTPMSTWPERFYIRVRVNVGRKSVYSRWITVNVISRATFVANPTCALKGWKLNPAWSSTTGYEMFFGPGETIEWQPWSQIWVHFIVLNTSRAEVRFRRGISVLKNGLVQQDAYTRHHQPAAFDHTTVRSLAPGKADTVTIGGKDSQSSNGFYRMYADGGGTDTYDMILTLMPLEAPDSKCTLRFYAK